MALTKADLANKLREELGMNKPAATLLVNQFLGFREQWNVKPG